FDPQWFEAARNLSEFVLEHFPAPDGGFFDTSDDHETLIARPRNMQDNAVPSGNAMMARSLIRLAAYTGEARYEAAARGTLALLTEAMRQYPNAFGEGLSAVDMLVGGLDEVAVVGDPARAETQALLDAIQKPYRPNAISALSADGVVGAEMIPLLRERTAIQGQPTVY
ncbi:MAG: thioredoxin domain-containing protein, partial [Phototrophicales bacterium]